MQTMRKTGTKIFSWVLLLLLLAGLLTGCGANDQENSADGQSVLRYGSGDYTAINPALYEHGEINALLFAGLTAHNEKNEVVPGLAEDWSFDEKTCTYTFSLRDGLTFHDGEPLTSADVKFTLEAILDEQNGSEIVSNYTDIAEIRCPDALTVEIRLTQPNAAFPDYMTIGILPEHLLAGKDLTTCAFNQNPVGAGPYRLKDWDMGQSITMERFDDYYGGQPQIEQVIFVIVPDSDARAMQLAAGKIDMAQITPKSAAQLADSEEIRVYRMETADYRAIAYNFANPYFERHPELPNILSYAIDREAIISGVLLGQGEAAYSPLQKSAYNNADIEHFTYDPEKAERLLVEAGWSKGLTAIMKKTASVWALRLRRWQTIRCVWIWPRCAPASCSRSARMSARKRGRVWTGPDRRPASSVGAVRSTRMIIPTRYSRPERETIIPLIPMRQSIGSWQRPDIQRTRRSAKSSIWNFKIS